MIASQNSTSALIKGKALDKEVSGRLIVVMESVAVLREAMVEIGRRMHAANLVAGTGGNMSCRLADGRYLITPSGKAKGRLLPSDLVVIDGVGGIISGSGKPSSEFRLHTFIYSIRGDIDAVLHAHPVYCTAFASSGRPLEASVLPEILLSEGEIPLAEYGTPSTEELPSSIAHLAENHYAMLLSNHGIVVGGTDLEDAYCRLEMIEHFAMILHAAEALGGAKPLSGEQIARLAAVKGRSGLSTRGED